VISKESGGLSAIAGMVKSREEISMFSLFAEQASAQVCRQARKEAEGHVSMP